MGIFAVRRVGRDGDGSLCVNLTRLVLVVACVDKKAQLTSYVRKATNFGNRRDWAWPLHPPGPTFSPANAHSPSTAPPWGLSLSKLVVIPLIRLRPFLDCEATIHSLLKSRQLSGTSACRNGMDGTGKTGNRFYYLLGPAGLPT